MNNEKIILVGFMGSGKTTIGKSIAQTINLPFIDSDQMIEEEEGTSIKELFEDKGEEYFRRLENKFVLEIGKFEISIISTGGGLPVYNNNMDHLNDTGITVYLNVPLSVLTKRILADKTRPLVQKIRTKDNLYKYIRETLKLRESYYKKAKICINCKNKSVQIICEEIINKTKTFGNR
jgi:shikimate kinase